MDAPFLALKRGVTMWPFNRKTKDDIATKSATGNVVATVTSGQPYRQLEDGTHTYNLSSPSDYNPSYRAMFNFRNAESNLITLFYNLPEVFAPINTIAEAVAKTLFEVRKVKDDSVTFDNKDLNRILSQPNPFQTLPELLYQAVCYEYLTGNQFFYAAQPESFARFDYKYLTGLWNLPASLTEITVRRGWKLFSATAKSDVLEDYRLNNSNVFLPERVLHLRNANLAWDENMFRGKPRLLAGERPLSNLVAVYEARNIIYVKQGALGMIVSKKEDQGGAVALTPKEKDNVKAEANSAYGITSGRSPFGVTDVPVDFIRMGMSIKDLEPFRETEASAAAIYGILSVPWDLRPNADGVTYENQKSAERRLYQQLIIPIAERYALALTSFLRLEEVGLYLKAKFDNVEALQENKKEQSEVFSKNVESFTRLYEKAGITKNQWLIGCGFEPLGPVGDVYITDIKNDTPLAVRLGVGGTEALIKVLSDTLLTDDQKKHILIIVFNIPEDQAAVMAVGNGSNVNPQNTPNA